MGTDATCSRHCFFVEAQTEVPGQVPHVWPSTMPQTAPAAEHALATHRPLVGSQRWPAEHETPVQSDSQEFGAPHRWPAAQPPH
jgi:hypothetical protein